MKARESNRARFPGRSSLHTAVAKAAEMDFSNPFALLSALGGSKKAKESKEPKIAVIYAVGGISFGKGEVNPLMGGDSVISQDIRVTKTFSFGEKMKLDLIGEVFNLFNVANLTTGGTLGFTLNPEGDGSNPIPPSERTTSVFGTGGPRAFQFAAKFRF